MIKILKVDWVDICEVPGWISGHEHIRQASGQPLPEPLHCTDVGFEVKSDRECLYLSKTYAVGDDGLRWGGIVVIPKGCIKEIQVLDKIKERSR